MSIKKFFKVKEFSDEVYNAQFETFKKGYSCGWSNGDDRISFKPGYTTYLYSHPHQGKTVFVTESLIHLAKNEGLKICIYSPESGSKKDIVWNLIQVYVGKKLYGKGAYKVSTLEIDLAIDFIDEHFIILEHEPFSSNGLERFTVKDIFNQVHLAQKQYNTKVDILCIDPFNLLDREENEDKKAIADYVLGTLSFINSASKKMNMHTILVAHLAAQDLLLDKETGIEYMPKPHPSGLAGGQSFWRAGFQMIGIHRLPYGMSDRTGMPYPENAMWIICQKTKPFGVGKLGHFELFFDTDSHTLYEKDDYDVSKRWRCGDKMKSFNDSMNVNKMPPMPLSSWHEQKSPLNNQLESPF